MLQLTSCLQEKGLLTVIVFRSLWLVKLFTKQTRQDWYQTVPFSVYIHYLMFVFIFE